MIKYRSFQDPNGQWCVLDDCRRAKCMCGKGPIGEQDAKDIAAALNREPERRGVEFVEVMTSAGPVNMQPALVRSVYRGTHGDTVVQFSVDDFWDAKGTLSEVLAKLRGERVPEAEVL